MKLLPVEHVWHSDEARKLFEAYQEQRDEVVKKMHVQLGDLPPPSTVSSAEILHRQITDPRRRAEIEEAWRPIIDGFNRKMADIMGKHTAPRLVMSKTE